MSKTLAERLRTLIETNGPIPLSVWMELCLHDREGGYYATRPGLSRDFVTAPEISQMFGELLGLWAVHNWRDMGSPAPFNFVELGPGRGILMQDALRAISATAPEFIEAMQLILLEASPTLRQTQSERLVSYTPQFIDSIEKIIGTTSIILANEFLDCLPARQFHRADFDGNSQEIWRELHVGLTEKGDFSPGLVDLPRGAEPPAAKDEKIVEIQIGLEAFVETLSANAGEFRSLFIDYGPANATPGDSVRAFSMGKQCDPFLRPGEVDITVDVDFARLKAIAERNGLSATTPKPQGEFLLEWGAQARLDQLLQGKTLKQSETLFEGVRRLIDPTQMGISFNCICISK